MRSYTGNVLSLMKSSQAFIPLIYVLSIFVWSFVFSFQKENTYKEIEVNKRFIGNSFFLSKALSFDWLKVSQ